MSIRGSLKKTSTQKRKHPIRPNSSPSFASSGELDFLHEHHLHFSGAQAHLCWPSPCRPAVLPPAHRIPATSRQQTNASPRQRSEIPETPYHIPSHPIPLVQFSSVQFSSVQPSPRSSRNRSLSHSRHSGSQAPRKSLNWGTQPVVLLLF